MHENRHMASKNESILTGTKNTGQMPVGFG